MGAERTGDMTTFDAIEDAIVDIAAGRMVVVVDDEDRENEGDLIFAAAKATPRHIAFMVRHCSGIICVPLEGTRLEELHLPLMAPIPWGPRSPSRLMLATTPRPASPQLTAPEQSSHSPTSTPARAISPARGTSFPSAIRPEAYCGAPGTPKRPSI